MIENDPIEKNELTHLHRRFERLEARFRIILGSVSAVIVAGVLLWAPLAMSEPDAPVETEYPDLYHFAPNTPAVAAEVNSNFATLHARADSNTQGLDSNTLTITSHTQSINSNTSRITSNEQDITSLQSGKLDSGAITRHGPYHAQRNNQAGTSSTRMIRLDRSVCFLTKVSMEDVDSHLEAATCEVVAQNGFWRLEAYLHANRDSDAWCSARCLKW